MRKCKSWIRDFLKYTEYLETSDLFLLWGALQAVSIALGRRVWRDMGYRRLYPNLYTVFVGLSGVGKSTAMDAAMRFVEKVCTRTILIRDSVTPEALMYRLSNRPIMLKIGEELETATLAAICATEMTTMVSGVKYKKHIVENLTRLYDCTTYEDETRKEGQIRIVNPYVNFWGCTTQARLTEAIPEEAIGGGFAGRILFICVDAHDRCIPFPEECEINHTLAEDLMHDLRCISNMDGGPVTLTSEARDFYEKWYRADKAKMMTSLPSPDFAGFASRRAMLINKLAIILSAAESDSRVLTGDHFSVAVRIMDEVEKNMSLVYSTVTQPLVVARAQVVRSFLLRRHEVTKTQLLRAVSYKMDGEELMRVLYYLRDLGEINLKPGRPMLIQATSRLLEGKPKGGETRIRNIVREIRKGGLR